MFGEESMSVHTTQNWLAKLLSGNMSHKDDHAGGSQPFIENDRFKQLVEQNPETAITECAEGLDAPKSMVYNHLKAIGIVKKFF